jgi:hypothetical protein
MQNSQEVEFQQAGAAEVDPQSRPTVSPPGSGASVGKLGARVVGKKGHANKRSGWAARRKADRAGWVVDQKARAEKAAARKARKKEMRAMRAITKALDGFGLAESTHSKDKDQLAPKKTEVDKKQKKKRDKQGKKVQKLIRKLEKKLAAPILEYPGLAELDFLQDPVTGKMEDEVEMSE